MPSKQAKLDLKDYFKAWRAHGSNISYPEQAWARWIIPATAQSPKVLGLSQLHQGKAHHDQTKTISKWNSFLTLAAQILTTSSTDNWIFIKCNNHFIQEGFKLEKLYYRCGIIGNIGIKCTLGIGVVWSQKVCSLPLVSQIDKNIFSFKKCKILFPEWRGGREGRGEGECSSQFSAPLIRQSMKLEEQWKGNPMEER